MSSAPTVSRRDLLAGAAAAGAGLLIEPGAVRAEAVAPGASGRTFSRSLGGLAGASATIVTGRRFVLAGVQWRGPAAAALQMRARGADGRWSRWALASVTGHEPDALRVTGRRADALPVTGRGGEAPRAVAARRPE
ncbi:MAG: hypothetical protein ACRDMX_11005, partial [Solirubrobacteraceae bacterium]